MKESKNVLSPGDCAFRLSFGSKEHAAKISTDARLYGDKAGTNRRSYFQCAFLTCVLSFAY